MIEAISSDGAVVCVRLHSGPVIPIKAAVYCTASATCFAETGAESPQVGNGVRDLEDAVVLAGGLRAVRQRAPE